MGTCRPKENEKIRDELEKAVQIIWNCRLPSPRVSRPLFLFPFWVVFNNFWNGIYCDSVWPLMLLLRLIWHLLYKYLYTQNSSLLKLGKYYTARKVKHMREFIEFVSWQYVNWSKIYSFCSSAIRTADELSKIMAFFYYGAAKPPCLNSFKSSEEVIPTLS